MRPTRVALWSLVALALLYLEVKVAPPSLLPDWFATDAATSLVRVPGNKSLNLSSLTKHLVPCIPDHSRPTRGVAWKDAMRAPPPGMRPLRGPNCTWEVLELHDAFLGADALDSSETEGLDGTAFTCQWHLKAGGCACCPQPRYRRSHGPIHSHPLLAVLTQYWAFGYGHWMMEAFPRVVDVHALLLANPEAKAVVPVAPFVAPLMALAGIGLERMVPHSPPATLHADVMYVPRASRCGVTSPSRARRLRRLVLGSPALRATAAEPPGLLLVINRAAGKDRHVRHIDTLVETLTEMRPTSPVRFVYLEGLPSVDQSRLFLRTRVVVAPHGAGLGNAMFMPPGAAIVELMPEGRWNGCYGNFAHAYGLRWSRTWVAYAKGKDGVITLNRSTTEAVARLTAAAWAATSQLRPAAYAAVTPPDTEDACAA